MPKWLAELKLMKHLYVDTRQVERLARVVEQRFSHALIARAEEAKIGVSVGEETMIDLNEIEEDLQITFDAARERPCGWPASRRASWACSLHGRLDLADLPIGRAGGRLS